MRGKEYNTIISWRHTHTMITYDKREREEEESARDIYQDIYTYAEKFQLRTMFLVLSYFYKITALNLEWYCFENNFSCN